MHYKIIIYQTLKKIEKNLIVNADYLKEYIDHVTHLAREPLTGNKLQDYFTTATIDEQQLLIHNEIVHEGALSLTPSSNFHYDGAVMEYVDNYLDLKEKVMVYIFNHPQIEVQMINEEQYQADYVAFHKNHLNTIDTLKTRNTFYEMRIDLSQNFSYKRQFTFKGTQYKIKTIPRKAIETYLDDYLILDINVYIENSLWGIKYFKPLFKKYAFIDKVHMLEEQTPQQLVQEYFSQEKKDSSLYL